MDESLHEHLSQRARWSRPDGGYFFWLEMETGIDVIELRRRSFDFGVGFQPGEVFSNTGEFSNFIRLSFAHYGEDDIREGISRLAKLLES